MARIAAVVGLQWGDEGKGKLVDILTANSNACLRYNGGSNAGHTVVFNNEKVGLHLLPCGIFHSNVTNIIGPGVVVNLHDLAKELDAVKAVIGRSVDDRVVISSRAHLTFRYHLLADGLMEDSSKGTAHSIGTTRRGIGPSYACKALRISVRACDLKGSSGEAWPKFREAYMRQLAFLKRAYDLPETFDHEAELRELQDLRTRFSPLISDIVTTLCSLMSAKTPSLPNYNASDSAVVTAGDRLLSEPWHMVVESANAVMLDINYGTYPYCTSSHVLPIGASVIDPRAITHVVGVVKAYTTRVGEGPCPTELNDEIGETLQRNGAEFGVSTGRKRRCGWLDLCVVKYSCFAVNPDTIMLTKLDVLSGIKELKICVRYKLKSGAQTLENYFPAHADELSTCECVYHTLPGWTEDLSLCKSYEEFPENAKKYVDFVESSLQRPILTIGVGPDRVNIITRNPTTVHH